MEVSENRRYRRHVPCGHPRVPVSAITGDGVDAVKQHLLDAAADMPPRPATGNFRLAIDRSFDVVGAGWW